mmetsp:Transcript_42360/g.65006  ORF Transcript_42360/g.65006 Transcript_42360/m.65006 type:complete len:85 (-) Transcript_42360:994-1248(-)
MRDNFQQMQLDQANKGRAQEPHSAGVKTIFDKDAHGDADHKLDQVQYLSSSPVIKRKEIQPVSKIAGNNPNKRFALAPQANNLT